MTKSPKEQVINSFTLIPADYQPVVVSSLKRSFSRGPVVREFLRKNRREEDWFKKDGTKAKKKHVFYTCAECSQEFNSTQVQVDHIVPVVPVNIPAKHMSIAEFIKRLYVEEDGLQILCKKHHKEKSNIENKTRKEWLTKVKYIVYQTINRINHKTYMGVHKCVDYDDGYLGSEPSLKKDIQKYGSQCFYRQVLFAFETPEEAYNKKQELMNDDLTKNVDHKESSDSATIICHQTGEIFLSMDEAAKSLNIDPSSIRNVINNPNKHIKNLHFFETKGYDPDVKVCFPADKNKRRLVYLNTRTIFESIETAASKLRLNYKNLTSALLVKNQDGVYSLDEHYFLYEHEYDPSMEIFVLKRKVLCVELNKVFDTCTDAAIFLKRKEPALGGIFINKAAKTGDKVYKFHWKYIEETMKL